MTEPAKYPFDYDALNKGDVIPTEVIEGLCNLPRTDHKYGLKLMSYQQQIQNELALRGKSVVVRCDHGALRILTDSEAAEHTAAVFNQRKRQMVRAHASAMRVDTGKLTDEQARAIALLAADAVNSGKHAVDLSPYNVQNWSSLAGMYRDLGASVPGATAPSTALARRR